MKYKIKLQGEDGKDYVITYAGLWDAIKERVMSHDEQNGWTKVSRALRRDVNRLKELILSEVLVSKATQQVLQFLKDNPNVKTRDFNHKDWLSEERSIAWNRAILELDNQGVIVSESHGRGQNRTWKIKES